MDLLILFRVLLKRKWYLILIPVVAVVSTYFFSENIKPIYKSTARLATGFTTDDQIKITDERLNLRDAEIKFNNLIQNMNSELVLNLLSYRLILNEMRRSKELPAAEKEEAIRIFRLKYDSMQLLTSFNPKEAKLIALMGKHGFLNWQLKDNFEIKRVKDTDYITVQYLSDDPMFSANAVNFLSEEFIRYDNSLRFDRSGQSVSFFEGLVKEKKKILDERTKYLNEFKVSNNALNYEAQSTTKMSQIMEYDLRREQLLSDIQRIRISLSSINRKLNETESPAGNDQAAINSNIVKIREKIAELNKEYERTGSTNQELANSVKDLRYQLQVEISKLSTYSNVPARNIKQDLQDQKDKFELELQIANANLENVNHMLGTLQGSVSGYASKEAAITEIQSEVDKAKEEYIQALDRFNTEQSKSLIAGSPIRIITKGQPNGHAEFSKRYMIVALSGVASLILCIFVIIFIEYLDVRIKTPQQFNNFVNIALAGSVNLINTKELNLGDLFLTKKDNDMEVFKHFLRKLRFEIESSKSRVILVTSTKNGEGKTFIIMCVAYLLSLLQKKILIIDTNFKNNSLTQLLLKKQQNTRKLEHGIFVKGQLGEGGAGATPQSEQDIADSIIYPTGHKGINIIGNNGGNESPSEIFAGRDFGDMIKRLSETYDYIIMEGASLNNFSDTKELVDYADKVLAVFSAESILKQIDRDSIKYLRSLNGKLMGAVLNKVETKDLVV